MNSIYLNILIFLAILLVLVTHEYAHALVALWNGDDTARNEGRLTLNPLKHLDLYGTIFLLLFKFGWAKPVPVNSRKFKNERYGLFTVSIAGILINLLTALFFSFIYVFIIMTKIDKTLTLQYIEFFIQQIIIYGIVFAVFNFIPIPPLDGSKVLASILPKQFQIFIYKYERYFYILLLVLFYTDSVNKLINPIISYLYNSFIQFSAYIIYIMGIV